MTEPTPLTDPAAEDYLRPCQHPRCGYVLRWWDGPLCPTHRAATTDTQEKP